MPNLQTSRVSLSQLEWVDLISFMNETLKMGLPPSQKESSLPSTIFLGGAMLVLESLCKVCYLQIVKCSSGRFLAHRFKTYECR